MKLNRFAVMILICTMFAGCAHYRVHAPNPNPGTDYKKETVHVLFWGLGQSKGVSAKNCGNNVIDEVRFNNYLWHEVATVLTLGIWMPREVEWKCAKEGMVPGEM